MMLASISTCPHIAVMGIQEDAVREALKSFPGSIRALAREAGVSEKLLRSIRDGDRTATTRTVGMIADAMEFMGVRQLDAARILRDAIRKGEA
jgi:hypothetical protein